MRHFTRKEDIKRLTLTSNKKKKCCSFLTHTPCYLPWSVHSVMLSLKIWAMKNTAKYNSLPHYIPLHHHRSCTTEKRKKQVQRHRRTWVMMHGNGNHFKWQLINARGGRKYHWCSTYSGCTAILWPINLPWKNTSAQTYTLFLPC